MPPPLLCWGRSARGSSLGLTWACLAFLAACLPSTSGAFRFLSLPSPPADPSLLTTAQVNRRIISYQSKKSGVHGPYATVYSEISLCAPLAAPFPSSPLYDGGTTPTLAPAFFFIFFFLSS